MPSPNGLLPRLPAAIACAAALVLCSACSPKTALPPEDWPGVIQVEVVLGKTTRQDLVDALGQPRVSSLEGGSETLTWMNDKGYVVMFSADGNPPAVSFHESQIEARLTGDVVTYFDAR
ncbi:MAG: hypothetical protein LBG06_12055 [Deltaproteobacteria bacterium]|jgi:hypothetical protein|nr:hypothetical protein [Deltaproteobacteria bacterium]